MSLKVKFPIGVKLVVIITALFFLSLGLITLLVALFVSADVERTARVNNINIDKMSALMVEDKLSLIKSNSMVLLENISVVAGGDEGGSLYTLTRMKNLFFSQNPDIAVIVNRGQTETIDQSFTNIVNDRFFLSNTLSASMIDEFIESNFQVLNRSLIGETIVINAAPFFNGIPLLAMSIPMRGFRGLLVLFSSESITDSFGTGANSTFIVNYFGDVLVHPDQELVSSARNLLQNPFISECIANPNTALEKRFRDERGRGYFGASQKLSLANIIVVSFISTDTVFEGINLTTRRNIYVSLGVWFLAVMFIWFFSKSISRPLEKLKAATEQIEAGDYSLDLKTKSLDETGVLTESVQSMSHVLRNFEVFTNKRLARLAREGKLAVGGVTRNATVFFSDIRSFTAMSEKLSPAEVVKFLNDYMDRMVSCVILTGGVIDKFIGDAIMAHWGALESAGSAEEDAFCGLRAALMMRASLYCFNRSRSYAKEPTIRIGCGLNSGRVVAGQIGSDERVVFTVIGETVSFADRTETFNKPFGTEILITEHTWRLVKKHIIAKEMGKVIDDGEDVKIFAVINIKDGPEADRLLKDLEKIPKTDPELCKKCVGPEGPHNIDELRALLGISAPDLSNLSLDEEEKKYSVAS
ncbi:MAG: adenylate/guanylate cyclase domain-containing protein [Spirochaetaceae bacterium]|jgi:adenylate cyclase|nr:adenylate/guanylate cyclase domain-containing protein [Spirochaetaceae bacterium]